MASPRVAIIGSGLTGLLTAQGLQKNGIEVTVYERDPSIDCRARDWTIMLHWGLEILSKILPEEVQKSFPQAFCDPFNKDEHPAALPCLDNNTSEPLFHIPSTWMRLTSRKRFRGVLSQGLNVQYGKHLQDIEESPEKNGPVTLVFVDGTRAEVDIVIGADGPRSAVREYLVGEDNARGTSSPWVISIAEPKYRDAEKAHFVRALHPVWQMVYGPEGIGGITVSDVGENNDPEEWQFYYFRIWREDLSRSLKGPEAVNRFKNMSTKLCEPFRSAAQWMPEDTVCHADQLKYWIPIPWDNRRGRVTLAGDAAHSVMPFRGQGFNHCMEDALKLIDAIVRIKEGADREEMMRVYDDDLLTRGKAAALASIEEGAVNMDYELLRTSKTFSKGFSKDSLEVAV